MLIFVAGALSAPTERLLNENIQQAALNADCLIGLGHTPIVPHTMYSRTMQDEAAIMACCLELVRICDAVYFVGAGPNSRAWLELEEAKKHGIPVFTSLTDVPAAEGVRA